VIGLVQVGSQAIAHRYTYVPLVGIFVMLAWALPGLGDFRLARGRAVSAATLAALLVLAGVAAFQASFWRDSVSLFSRALELDPENYTAHESLADALARQGRFEPAKRHAEEALRIAGKRSFTRQVYITLGNIADREGRPAEAFELFGRAIEIDPRNARAYYNQAVLLMNSRQFERAATVLEETVKLAPESAQARNDLGFCLMNLGRAEEAAAHYRRAVELDPGFAEAYFNLGVAMDALERPADAVAAYDEAVRLAPQNAAARLALGRALLRSGRSQEARVQLEAVLRLDPGNLPAQRLLQSSR
jgi:superkiller protein 3